MPKTRVQEVVFSFLMAVTMVYAMELYNLALAEGGLVNRMFFLAGQDLLPLSLCVIVLEKLLAGPCAKRLAFRIVIPGQDRPIVVILAISIFTVCLMCPFMSCVATILFKQAGKQFLAVWLQTTAQNFPMAFCWQIFFAGPGVRFLFRKIFARQLAQEKA